MESESLTFPIQTLFVNFEQISHLCFVFLLFTLSKQIQAKKTCPKFFIAIATKIFLMKKIFSDKVFPCDLEAYIKTYNVLAKKFIFILKARR